MASLAPGVVLPGKRWNYRILDPIKGDTTHISNAFKAEVVPRENTRHVPKAPQWFVVLHRLCLDTQAKIQSVM